MGFRPNIPTINDLVLAIRYNLFALAIVIIPTFKLHEQNETYAGQNLIHLYR